MIDFDSLCDDRHLSMQLARHQAHCALQGVAAAGAAHSPLTSGEPHSAAVWRDGACTGEDLGNGVRVSLDFADLCLQILGRSS